MVRSRNKQPSVMNCSKATPMTSDDKQLMYLEKMVNNQKQMIDLMSMLNNNVEELISDIRDLKNSHKIIPAPFKASSANMLSNQPQQQLSTVPMQLSQLPNLNAVSNGGPTITTVLLHNNHNGQPRTAIPLTTFKSFNPNNSYQLFQTNTTASVSNGNLTPSVNLAPTTTLNAIPSSLAGQQPGLGTSSKSVLASSSNVPLTPKVKTKSSRSKRNTIVNELGNRSNTSDANTAIINDTNLNSHQAGNGITSANSSDDIMQYDHHAHHHHHHHHHHHQPSQDDGPDGGLKTDEQNNMDVHLDLNNNESDNLSLSEGRIKYNQAHAFINTTPNENANSIMNNSSSDSNIENQSNAMCDMVDSKIDSFPILMKSVKSGLREFSTFVSKKVRLEFGFDSLASKRINELDREIMNKIKDEAIEKYLPSNVAPQLAWNHAMNSLRQLRHRQCKKLKPF